MKNFNKKLRINSTLIVKAMLILATLTTLNVITLFVLIFGLDTLSATRAFVGAEGSWAKAQKSAVISLKEYATNYNIKEYEAFKKALKVQKGDTLARNELEKSDYNKKIVYKGFIDGQLSKDDIDDVIKLFKRFRKLPKFNKAINIWILADDKIEELIKLGKKLNQIVLENKKDTSKLNSNKKIKEIIKKITLLDKELLLHEINFSKTLGEVSRLAKDVLVKLLIVFVISFGAIGAFITLFFIKKIINNIKNLDEDMREIFNGNLSKRAVIESKDEFGSLCQTFNDMAQYLEISAKEVRESTIQLVQAEKLSTLGEMVSVVVHELSQPLNGIKIISQSIIRDIKKELLQTEILEEDLSDVVKQINKMAEIIDHMRIYTRKGETNVLEKVSINNIIQGTFKFIRQQLKTHNISLKLNLHSPLPYIKGDVIRLEQVFLNLLTNARHSLESSKKEKKILNISTYILDESKICVEIFDNGIGMSEDLKNKIFDKFFTTKKSGKGTGLGLSIVKRIIEEHSGEIEVESEPEKGTKFTITFPWVASSEHSL